MFLVLDRDRNAVTDPYWIHARKYSVRRPAPLEIPAWDVRPGDLWLINGPDMGLRTLVHLLRSKNIWQTGQPEPAAPQVRWIGQRTPASFLGRVVAGIRRARPVPPNVQGYLQAWIEDLPQAVGLERSLLVQTAEALVENPDVLIFDRILNAFRPEVRFRVASSLRSRAATTGLTVIAVDPDVPDGWIAVERRGAIRRGVLHRVLTE